PAIAIDVARRHEHAAGEAVAERTERERELPRLSVHDRDPGWVARRGADDHVGETILVNVGRRGAHACEARAEGIHAAALVGVVAEEADRLAMIRTGDQHREGLDEDGHW